MQLCTSVLESISLKERIEVKVDIFRVSCSLFQLVEAACWKEERPREQRALGILTRMCEVWCCAERGRQKA